MAETPKYDLLLRRALGIPLEDAVPMVTSNPAQMIGMSDSLGAIKPAIPPM
jgi:N-acetylglucosamine-6-phosphate deacetylase